MGEIVAGRRGLRLAASAMLAALAAGCAATPNAGGRSFVIPTGAQLTMPAGTTLQPVCMFHDIDEDITPAVSACVEYPHDLAERTGADVLAIMDAQLVALGYERTGGSETVSWYRTPAPPGCRLSLNVVTAPRTAPIDGDPASAGTLVAAFIAEKMRCD